MRFTTCLIFVCLSGPALAAEWTLRPGDTPFTAHDAVTLEGRTLTFYDDGRSTYEADGVYSYTYAPVNGGGTAWGDYSVMPDGSICIAFRNGLARCDLYVRSGDRLVLITEAGERYPVRPD